MRNKTYGVSEGMVPYRRHNHILNEVYTCTIDFAVTLKFSARITLGSRQDCQMLGARERDFRLIPMTARQTVFYKRCSLTNCRL